MCGINSLCSSRKGWVSVTISLILAILITLASFALLAPPSRVCDIYVTFAVIKVAFFALVAMHIQPMSCILVHRNVAVIYVIAKGETDIASI
jgi:hypothetical protein